MLGCMPDYVYVCIYSCVCVCVYMYRGVYMCIYVHMCINVLVICYSDADLFVHSELDNRAQTQFGFMFIMDLIHW